jgi:hypothetical protein
MNLTREVESVIDALDTQRRTGFCDEHGILQAWADELVSRAAAEAKVYGVALTRIATNEGLSKNRMVQLAKNALAKARRLMPTVN